MLEFRMRQPIEVPRAIRTERLLLRPLRKSDARLMFEAIEESRAHLSQWLNWIPEIKRADDLQFSCESAALDWEYGTDFRTAIFTADGKRYLGHCGLHYPNWEVRSFEIGYWLRVSAVGQGIMREAVGGLTTYALEDLKARRVEIHCDPNNARSSGVALANGYLLEGRLRDSRLTPAGKLRDTLIYGMTETDFHNRK
jgi:ribosomal-protein-serine acetyltransferase